MPICRITSYNVCYTKLLRNRLTQIAATDQLTSLPNKLRFMSVVKKQCAAITSAPSRLVLAYLRMDHMQHINNIYGYKTGDRTLIKVAKVLAEEIRDGEISYNFV